MLNPAPLESARFGLRVYRATPTRIDAEVLLAELIAERVDLAIIRTPVHIPNGLQALEVRGLRPFHADTLVSYECPLSDYLPRARGNPGCQIERADAADRDPILALVQTVFAAYPNHYRANPLLPADTTGAGYGEWALSHLDGDHKIAWVARVGNRIAAIACSAFDDAGMCHGILHGVHPDFVGGGIYTDLIRHTQHYFRERGFHTLRIQTQVGNLPVQRAWVREGFTFAAVFDTFHINALLDTGHVDPHAPGCVSGHVGKCGAVAPGKIATRFLEAAIELAAKSGIQALDATPRNCHIAIWSQAAAAGKCEVRVRAYPTSLAHDFVSATLHDARGNICALARFNAAPSHHANTHHGGVPPC